MAVRTINYDRNPKLPKCPFTREQFAPPRAANCTRFQVLTASGILLGHDDSTAYIATARHVVEKTVTYKGRDGTIAPDSIFVQFRWSQQPHPARIRRKAISPDLAVLSVGINTPTRRDIQRRVPFNRQVRHAPNRENTPLYSFGCPVTRGCWQWTPQAGEYFERLDDPAQGDSAKRKPAMRYVDLDRGYSGGPIFTERGELVGQVRQLEGVADAPYTPIDEVLDSARAWGAQLRIAKSSVPPGGYRLSIGLAVLRGSDPAPNPELEIYDLRTETWGFRVDATYHTRSPLSVSAGVATLVGRSSSVFGVFGGVNVNLLRIGNPDERGGLWAPVLSAFADVGIATIQTLADSGGYWIGNGSEPAADDDGYVPGLVADSYTTLGGETGLRLETFVLPRFSVGLVLTALGSPEADPGSADGHYAGLRLMAGVSVRYGLW